MRDRIKVQKLLSGNQTLTSECGVGTFENQHMGHCPLLKIVECSACHF
jgi:hypothetical protein